MAAGRGHRQVLRRSARASRRGPRPVRRRGPRSRRGERLGQVDAAEGRLRPGPAAGGTPAARRPRDPLRRLPAGRRGRRRGRHPGDDARAEPERRREHHAGAAQAADVARDRLAGHEAGGPRRAGPAAPRARPRRPGRRPASRPAADGRDRARDLHEGSRADPRRAHELAGRRRGRGAVRRRPRPEGPGPGDRVRLAPDERALRPRRPRSRSCATAASWRRGRSASTTATG